MTDNLESACTSLLAIKDPSLRLTALKGFLERLPKERWGSLLLAMNTLGSRGEFEDQPGSFLSARSLMESTLWFMTQQGPVDLLTRVREANDGQGDITIRRRDETGDLVFRFWAG
ncbi:MAG: hypothetical protein ACKV19_13025, partial [Verrucomicrobiales bacterium]